MKKIKFVYFDVGGVAILDFSGTNKWNEMKRDLELTEKNEVLFEQVWSEYEDEINIHRDVDTFIPILEKKGLIFPKGYSMLADFINRFERNHSIWPVIDTIHKSCSVGLLTNMYPRLLQAIQKQQLLPAIPWDVIIDSSKVGYKKPDRRIYELSQKKAKVKHSEILFVDNLLVNIKAAEELGWQTFLYDSISPKVSSKKLLSLF